MSFRTAALFTLALGAATEAAAQTRKGEQPAETPAAVKTLGEGLDLEMYYEEGKKKSTYNYVGMQGCVTAILSFRRNRDGDEFLAGKVICNQTCMDEPRMVSFPVDENNPHLGDALNAANFLVTAIRTAPCRPEMP